MFCFGFMDFSIYNIYVLFYSYLSLRLIHGSRLMKSAIEIRGMVRAGTKLVHATAVNSRVVAVVGVMTLKKVVIHRPLGH